MTNQIAEKFVHDWLEAFNTHNIDAILDHYADDIRFYSPLIPLLKFNEEGVIENKTDLKKYFERGLTTYPDLHFKLHNFFVGINTVVIHYTSVGGRVAVEVFQLNDVNKAVLVFCNYSQL
jgi:hypothetical protein